MKGYSYFNLAVVFNSPIFWAVVLLIFGTWILLFAHRYFQVIVGFIIFILALTYFLFLINYDFFAIALVIIYLGAVIVLFIFFLMTGMNRFDRLLRTPEIKINYFKEIVLNFRLFFFILLSLLAIGLFFFIFNPILPSYNGPQLIDMIHYNFKLNHIGKLGFYFYKETSLVFYTSYLLVLALIGGFYLLNKPL